MVERTVSRRRFLQGLVCATGVFAAPPLLTGCDIIAPVSDLKPTQTPARIVQPTVAPTKTAKEALREKEEAYDRFEESLKAVLSPDFIKTQPKLERCYECFGGSQSVGAFVLGGYGLSVALPNGSNGTWDSGRATFLAKGIGVELPGYSNLSNHPELSSLVEQGNSVIDARTQSVRFVKMAVKQGKEEELARLLFSLPKDMKFGRSARGIEGLLPLLPNGNKILVTVDPNPIPASIYGFATYEEITPAMWKRKAIIGNIREYISMTSEEIDELQFDYVRTSGDLRNPVGKSVVDQEGYWRVWTPSLGPLDVFTKFNANGELEKLTIAGKREKLDAPIPSAELVRYISTKFYPHPFETFDIEHFDGGKLQISNAGYRKTNPEEPNFELVIDSYARFGLSIDYTAPVSDPAK